MIITFLEAVDRCKGPWDEILKALGLAISIAFTLFNELSGGAICFATPALWYGIISQKKLSKNFSVKSILYHKAGHAKELSALLYDMNLNFIA